MSFRTTKPATICGIDDLNELLLAVLPAFIALAKDIIDSHNNALTISHTTLDKSDENFYNEFYSDSFTLNLYLPVTNLTRSAQNQASDEEEVRQKLMLILDELESRFLKRHLLQQLTDFNWRDSAVETYPKLRALRGRLGVDGAADQAALSCVRDVVRLASSSRTKRLNLLKHLKEAIILFAELKSVSAEEDGPPCPVRFETLPFRHIHRHGTTLYNQLRQGWSCSTNSGCYIESHFAHNVQLSLTEHRRFGTAPIRNLTSSTSQASFRVLFPTRKGTYEWQVSQIDVNDHGHEDAERQELMDDLCIAIRDVPRGCRLRIPKPASSSLCTVYCSQILAAVNPGSPLPKEGTA
ncbi:hypothetical protein BDW60DRAFT_170669 [Aspergillus nidulans var. acristatus]